MPNERIFFHFLDLVINNIKPQVKLESVVHEDESNNIILYTII